MRVRALKADGMIANVAGSRQALLSHSSVNTCFLSTQCTLPYYFSEQWKEVHGGLYSQIVLGAMHWASFNLSMFQISTSKVFRCPHQISHVCRVSGAFVSVFFSLIVGLTRWPGYGLRLVKFNIDSADKPDVCLFTITTLQVAGRLVCLVLV